MIDLNPARMTVQTRELISGCKSWVSALANVAAWFAEEMGDVSWCGFYIKKGNQLLLGPFVGRMACTTIAWGAGVCGTAAATQSTQLVADVHTFAGHIACDAATNSELVVPLIYKGEVVAVLDLDSRMPARFGVPEQKAAEAVAHELVSCLAWDEICRAL